MKHPAILLACLLLLGACHRSGRPVTLQGETQGTYYSIIYFDPGQRNLQPQVDSLLQLVDRTASLWNEHSLIRRINSGQPQQPAFSSCTKARPLSPGHSFWQPLKTGRG